MTLPDPIETAVARYPWPKPHFAKRGRNPERPYAAVLDHGDGHYPRTEQIRGRHFASADEARAYAAIFIDQMKAWFRQRLLKAPQHERETL